MQKTFAWFETNNIPYIFHDYKKEGAQLPNLKRWSQKIGWDMLLNRSGLTWKKQSPETQNSISNEASALQFLQSNPSAIKRPVIESEDLLIIGYNETTLCKSLSI